MQRGFVNKATTFIGLVRTIRLVESISTDGTWSLIPTILGKRFDTRFKDDSVGGYLILLKKKGPKERAPKTTKQPSRLEGLEEQMPELFAEMRQDLSQSPFIREFVAMKKSWSYNSDPNNPIFFYYFDDHENLTGKLTVLENHGLVTEITYNNVKRYTMSEEFVAYLTGQSQR